MTDVSSFRFTSILRSDLIIPDADYRDREDALTSLAGILVERGFCRELFVEAIIQRERAYPSALSMGEHNIAIPHTDATYVNHSVMLFARLREPVRFYAMGDPGQTLQVSMISMFALHDRMVIGDYLHTLITVYQDPTVLGAIHGASDGAEIFRILRDNVERTQARE